MDSYFIVIVMYPMCGCGIIKIILINFRSVILFWKIRQGDFQWGVFLWKAKFLTGIKVTTWIRKEVVVIL